MGKVTTEDFTEVFHGNKNILVGRAKSLNLVDSFLKNKLSVNYDNIVLPARPADVVRILAQDRKVSAAKIYHNIIMNYILNAEKRCPGSSLPFVLLLNNNYQTQDNKRRSTEEEAFNVLRSYVGLGQIYDTVSRIIRTAGFHQKLNFRLHNCESISIRVSAMRELECFIDPHFGSIQTELVDGIVIYIDGVVESVGEIDSVLSWSNAEKRPVFILAHGFSPDVSNTLKKNYELGNTKVFPFLRKVKEEDGLLKNDSNLVSNETGLRISNLDFDNMDSIDTCIIKRNKLSIQSDEGSKRSVDVLIPIRLRAAAGLIEDRIKCGLLVFKSAAKYGTSKIITEDEEFWVSRNALEFSKKSLSSFIDASENIACSILPDAK